MCTLTFFFENIDNYDSESYNIKKRNRFHIKVKMKNINIKSIAQEAGVSRTTVSRVLNNSGYVNIETKKKVDQVIKKYGYTPSAFARYLHKGHSDIIGVLIPEIENPFFGEILKVATVYKGNIIKNLIMDCQSYTKYRPNETTGGIFVSWRRKEELPTGA